MSKSRFILVINALIALLLAGKTSVRIMAQTDSAEPFKNNPPPIISEIYDEAEPDSPASLERIGSKKLMYDRPLRNDNPTGRNGDLTKLPDGVGVGVGSEDPPVKPLPVEPQTMVVIGTISKAQAYLTESKTAIFTEYNLQIERVLKNSTTNLIIPKGSLNFDNLGGSLRLKNDKVIHYDGGGGASLPKAGYRYLLFLKAGSDAKTLIFVNGYKLEEGKVFPLKEKWHLDIKTKSFSNITPYKDLPEPEFIQVVLNAIHNP